MAKFIAPTLAEAKRHWKGYTKSVLNTAARKAFRKGEQWTTAKGGYPVVTSTDHQYVIVFVKDAVMGTIQGRDPSLLR